MGSMIARGRGREQGGVTNRMDQLFNEWLRTLPLRRPFGMDKWPGEGFIRVDEFRDGDTRVIRAELPGIDPDRDVELTVAHGSLTIAAERRAEQTVDQGGYQRRELRYGRLRRTLPLPEGAKETDITAKYHDGILEIRVPVSASPPVAAKKIAINKS